MAPKLRIAKSAIDHSGRFSEIKATRSEGRTPASARPNATCRTRPTNSLAEIRTHSLPRFSLTVSGLLWRATASRHIAVKVKGPSKLFSSGEIVAAVAEDTLETISLDWAGGSNFTGR